MQIPHVTIFAAPDAYLGEIRNEIEARANEVARLTQDTAEPITNQQAAIISPVGLALLAGMQNGLNRAIRRTGVDVAPLTRKIEVYA